MPTFKSIEWKDVFTFQGKYRLDIPDHGLFLIEGKNGTGKTSVLNLFSTSLFETNEGKVIKDKILHKLDTDKRSKDGYIRLNIDDYTVCYERGLKYNNKDHVAESGSDWYINRGNNVLKRERLTDTDAIIHELIGIDYNQYISSIHLKQGSPLGFFTLKDSERMKLATKMLGAEYFDEASIEAKAQADVMELDLARLNGTVEEGKIQLNSIEEQGKQTKETLGIDVDKLSAEIIDKEAQIKTIQDKMGMIREGIVRTQMELTNISDKRARLNIELHDLQREVSKMGVRYDTNAVDSMQHDLQEAQGIMTQEAEVQAQLLGIIETLNELNKRSNEYRNNYAGNNGTMEQLKRAIDINFRFKNMDVLKAELQLLSRNTADETSLQKSIDDTEAKQRNLAENKLKLQSELSHGQGQIENLKRASALSVTDDCPVCGQHIDADKYEAQKVHIADEINTIETVNKKTRADIIDMDKQVSELEAQRKTYSKQMSDIKNIQVQITALNTAISNLQEIEIIGRKNAQLNELIVGLEAQIKEQEAQKKNLEAAKKRIDDSKIKSTELQLRLSNVDKHNSSLDMWEKKITKVMGDIAAIPQDEEERLKQTMLSFQQDSKNQQVSLGLLNTTWTGLKTQMAAYQQAKDMHKNLQNAYREKAKKVEATEKEIENLQIKQHFYSWWYKNFKKLKVLQIKSSIEAVQTLLDAYIVDLFDGRIRIKFEVVAPKQDQKNAMDFKANELKIVINNDSSMPVEGFSGAQKQLMGLAMLLALNDYYNFKVVFLDEIFGSLDDDNKSRVIKLLTHMQDKKAIFIISHINEIKGAFEWDHIYTVKSVDGHSQFGIAL